MDTIGLLAAWVGVVSFLFAIVAILAIYLVTSPIQQWWAKTSHARAQKRIQRLFADLATNELPSNSYLSDIVSLYGAMILTLVAGMGLVIVSIQILDLAPALLASMLPFNIDSKILTRLTGVFLFAASYFFIFRLSYLALKIRFMTSPRRKGFAQMAMKEIVTLRERHGVPSERVAH